ncbi:MAG: HTTM domain-containing protein [Polyangiaceae bacterium]
MPSARPSPPSPFARLCTFVASDVDIASLAAFRVSFGVAMMVLVARFFAHGWIREYYLTPRILFPHATWIRPWPGLGMYVHYGAMGVLALLVALGLFARPAVLLFGALFTYAHFLDRTNWLNHYWLVSLLTVVLASVPCDRALSVRVLRDRDAARATIPGWCLALVRFQIGIVYVFGGIAKLKGDWLLHAEPLRIWLGANTDFPILGRAFGYREAAYAMSWGGAAFDLFVVPCLLVRRTRVPAYLALLAFHGITARLFQLGMFPWIMASAALVFFEPSWPRAFLPPRAFGPVVARRTHPTRAFVPGLAAFVLFQILFPFRHLLYPGNVLWTEQGFRFSWNVMLMEKNGAIEFTVVTPDGRRSVVDLSEWLTRYQIKMMATQPDMIVDFAHVVAEDARARGKGTVRVFVDARVALNGRAPTPLVDPHVDLARENDTFAPKTWVTPAPTAPPQL